VKNTSNNQKALLFQEALSKHPPILSDIDTTVEEAEEISNIINMLKKMKSYDVLNILEGRAMEDNGCERICSEKKIADDSYHVILRRLFGMIKTTPISCVKKLKLRTPQVAREGRKTFVVNFVKICDGLNRSQQHVMDYVFAELATSGNMDSEQHLILRGAFKAKDIETLVKNYAAEYVYCKNCKGLDTELKKDAASRLFVISCNNCHATRTAQNVKGGFVVKMRQ